MFTYGTLGIQSNGKLTARLGLLGSAGIVNDRLVVCVLALKVDVSLLVLSSLGKSRDVRGRSSWNV